MTEAKEVTRLGREYETIYILRPDVVKEAAEKVANRVADAVSREGGRLTLVDTWGRRALAYPIRKHRRGVYVYVKYLGSGAVVNEIERNLRMLDDVLRFQTVLVSDEVDLTTVSIDPEVVKFEAIEPPTEPEEELSRERELGLTDPPEGERRREPSFDPDDIDDNDIPNLEDE